MSKISVIVPIYNVEKYISFCLDSIRRQSFSDIEILCVLDGSTDRSGIIARKHAANDERIRIIEKTNGGLSSARNAGILAATGKYLIFVDSDDFLEKNACKEVLSAFEAENADVVTFGAHCVPACDGNPWLIDCLSPSDAVYDGFDSDILFKEKSRPYVWRTAVRRALLMENNLLFDEAVAFGEDQVFHFELYPVSAKTVFLSSKLYGYRVSREGSLMSSYAEEADVRVVAHLSIVQTILQKWELRGFLGLCPADLLDWILDFLYIDIRNLPRTSRDEAFMRLGQMIDASLVKSAEGDLNPVCTRILQAAMAGDATILSSKSSIARYCIYRLGLRVYVRDLLLAPFDSFKKRLRRRLPLSAVSAYRCFDGMGERAKVEQELQMSLQLLDVECRCE